MTTWRTTITIDALRQYAVARTFLAPTTLSRAIARLGFVQADPIRAPARAQDLTVRHRVRDYRAGDLERRDPRLAIEEDCFVNYGFLPRALHALMHPRAERRPWTAARLRQAHAVRDFCPSRRSDAPDLVRLLAPFDALVWDRDRFEVFWNWRYRFEAYTPAPKRRLGYYALPLLWRDAVIGWANVSRTERGVQVAPGYVARRLPRERGYRDAFEAEVARLQTFLGLEHS